ncbi:Na+/H+ antiporter subunit E [Mycolicibacterium sp. XJ1819]
MTNHEVTNGARTRRLVLRGWVLCWLVLVWILLWGSFSVGNILSGLGIALLITMLLPLPEVPVQGRVHPISLMWLVVKVAYYLIRSSFQIAILAIKPGPPPLSAVLRAHLSLKSDLVLALSVNIFNLIPGSIVLEIDLEHRMLYMHVFDVGSDRGLDRFYRQVSDVERMLIRAFEREEDWHPANQQESA